MDAEMVTAILAGVLSIITFVLNWIDKRNRKFRDKMNDLKLERYKQETERLGFKRSENTAKVFGELWKVLYETKADRVYIVQPHPLGNAAFLSIYFEVKRKGGFGHEGQRTASAHERDGSVQSGTGGEPVSLLHRHRHAGEGQDGEIAFRHKRMQGRSYQETQQRVRLGRKHLHRIYRRNGGERGAGTQGAA